MRRSKLMVWISFESGHSGGQGLIDAYSQLVPINKRRANAARAAASTQLKNVTWSCRRSSR